MHALPLLGNTHTHALHSSPLLPLLLLLSLSSLQLLSLLLQLQASSAQGVELFEDLLWDIAKLSFAEHIFAPSLTHFPAKPDSEGFAESRAIVGDMFDTAGHPYSFALHLDLQDPIVLVAETEQDYLRWTAVLKIACDANSEANVEKLKKLVIPDYCKDPVHPDHPTAGN
jgi:hypothetical protein